MVRSARRSERRGTSAIEAAFVLPVFLFMIFALIEFGHAQMVNNVLRSACREGARLGSTTGSSSSGVETHVRNVLSSAINPAAVTVYVKSAASMETTSSPDTAAAQLEAMPDIELADAKSRQMFMVRAKVPYNAIALVPMPFMDGVVLQSQAFIRHE